MKSFLLSLSTVFSFSFASGQMFDIDTILYNGSIDDHINIVVLSDGYTEGELDKFSEDALSIKDALFNEVPYVNYQNFFNVFAIKVPSNESGASHPGDATDVSEPAHPIKTVDNYFGSSFDAFGIHRLLVPLNSARVFNTLAQNFPQYDQVMILVNSTYYGGSGGQFATSSLNASAAEIAIHELGHSFVDLIDEYYAGDQYANEGINMTGVTNPQNVKWKNWLGYKDVGIYQHCCGGASSFWHRPHENCKMRFLGPPFCPVCIEGTIEVIHDLVPMIVGYSPEKMDLSEEMLPITLKLDLTLPMPNTLAVNWSINGSEMEGDLDSMVLTDDDLEPGINEILVTVEDQSDLIRIDGHDGIHMDFVVWEIEKKSSSISDLGSDMNSLKIDIYPNPTQDVLIFDGKTETLRSMSAEILDLLGSRVRKVNLDKNGQTEVNIEDLSPGTYIVHFKIGKNRLGSSKIVKH